MNKKLLSGLAALTLAGTLALGGSASASGGDGTGPTGDRATKICNNLDSIEDLIQSRIDEVNHRIGYLTELRGKAETAGKTKLVAKIDDRIAKLNDRAAKLADRAAKLATWASTHCTTGEPTTTTTPSTTTPVEEPTTTAAA